MNTALKKAKHWVWLWRPASFLAINAAVVAYFYWRFAP